MYKVDNLCGRYLTLADEEFTDNVEKDIRAFIERHPFNSVLIFPPVNNFRRFLIHKTCENLQVKHDIVTFSIGQGIERRTVVCFRIQLIDKSVLKNDRQNNWRQDNFEETRITARPKSYERKIMGVENKLAATDASTSKGVRLNSVGIYRPPAIRKSLSVESTTITTTSTTSTIPITTTTTSIKKDEATGLSSSVNSIHHNSHSHNNINNDIKLTNELLSNKPIIATLASPSASSSTQRQRRPDRAVYIPRARRCSELTPSQIVPEIQSLKSTIIKTNDSIDKLETINLDNKNNTITTIENNNDNRLNYNKNNFNSDEHLLVDQKQKQNKIIINDNLTIINKQENNQIIIKNCELIDKIMMSKKNDTKINILRIEDATNNGITTIEKDASKDDKDEIELRKASQEINRSNRRIIKQTFRSDVLEISEPLSPTALSPTNETIPKEIQRTVNPETEDWDTMFDDNGDCLDPKLINELTSCVGKVNIEKPKFDYKDYEAKQAILNDEEYPHVLEVSNFPVEFKTQDLMRVFSEYKETGFDFKWVDDTHALAVFSSSRIAAEVLAMGHPFVLLKPLAEATVESRNKAKKCSSSLQPYRPRPETCAALARRLVTGALGVRLKTAREELENERKVLREAKERKILAAKQRQEIWEG